MTRRFTSWMKTSRGTKIMNTGLSGVWLILSFLEWLRTQTTSDYSAWTRMPSSGKQRLRFLSSLLNSFPHPNKWLRTGSIQPICLPDAFSDKMDVSDDDKEVKPDLFIKHELHNWHWQSKVEVYTSGWGRVFSSCVTNELGPLKHLKCKKPFLHRGKRFDGCSSGRNPSAQVTIEPLIVFTPLALI